MTLTDAEIKLVEEHRCKKAEATARREKRATCKHDWLGVCEMRRSTVYKCSSCGEIKLE